MISGKVEALLTTEMLPVELPAAEEKCTVKVTVCPGGKLSGRVGPVRVKPTPVMVTWEMVTPALPVFVTTTDNAPLVLAETFAKFRVAGVAEIIW